MPYSENDTGEVVLTLDREDFNFLLMVLGRATAATAGDPHLRKMILGLVNRMMMGNPRFTPYQEEES